MIIHTEEVQPVCRCRGSGLRPRPVLEQRGHGFRVAPAAPDVNEGAHNCSHHMAEETIAGDLIREKAALGRLVPTFSTTLTPAGSANVVTAQTLEGAGNSAQVITFASNES